VSRQQPFAVFARDQVCDLGRDEARELRALALDCVEEPGVGQGDGRLVGEGLNERDVVVRERLRLAAHQDEQKPR
jgi:hypothetical protein